MLTAIRKCFDLIRQHTGRRLSLAEVPEEDPAVYEMMGQADTMGVFQIESRAQMSMLPRLKPNKFYDLVIEVAIVRPGPIQGNMVHPYFRRRAGEEPVTYPSEAIRDVLTRTLGVPLFQEQAMRLAVVAAGFTPGEADQLRLRDGRLAAARHHRTVSPETARRHGTARAHSRIRAKCVSADQRVWRVRISRVARGQLCAVGLCVGLAQTLLPGRLHLRRC